MTLKLPPELIEHTIGFLSGDLPSLASCSLLCHGLLEVSRSLLWSDITLPVLARTTDASQSQPFKQLRFLEIVQDSPFIAQYVNHLTIEWPLPSGAVPEWDTLDIWEKLPNLRALTLRRVNVRNFDAVLVHCRRLGLATLVIQEATCMWSWVPSQPVPAPRSPVRSTTGRDPALKSLKILGGSWTTAPVAMLADAVVGQGMDASLRELVLCWTVHNETINFDGDMFASWERLFAATRDRLTRCELNIPQGGADSDWKLHRTFDFLRPCSALRSLTIHGDVPEVRPGSQPFLFLHALADSIGSAASPPRFPFLEELRVTLSCSVFREVVLSEGSEDITTFEALADALVGEHWQQTRHPLLRRVSLRALLISRRFGAGWRVVRPRAAAVQEAVRLNEQLLRSGMARVTNTSRIRLTIDVACAANLLAEEDSQHILPLT